MHMKLNSACYIVILLIVQFSGTSDILASLMRIPQYFLPECPQAENTQVCVCVFSYYLVIILLLLYIFAFASNYLTPFILIIFVLI